MLSWYNSALAEDFKKCVYTDSILVLFEVPQRLHNMSGLAVTVWHLFV